MLTPIRKPTYPHPRTLRLSYIYISPQVPTFYLYFTLQVGSGAPLKDWSVPALGLMLTFLSELHLFWGCQILFLQTIRIGEAPKLFFRHPLQVDGSVSVS